MASTPLTSSNYQRWLGHGRFFSLDWVCSVHRFCLTLSWVITPQWIPERFFWTNWFLRTRPSPINYLKWQQCHYCPITDQEIKCRGVLKGIIWAILGFLFFFFASHVVLLPSVVNTGVAICTSTWKEEEICFPQHGCLATTAVPCLWWEPSIPLQRDPHCIPNWGLFKAVHWIWLMYQRTPST